MSEKIRVLHLLSSNRFSGAENVVFQIINLFKDDSFEMVYSSKDGQIRDACAKEKIKFYPLTKISLKEVSKVIKDFNPDIIHAHDVKASVIASFFSSKTKIISHMHVNHENMSKVNFKTLAYIGRANKFKHIFWVSSSAFNKFRFRNRLSSKSSILYNVVDSEKIISKSRDDSNHYTYDVVYLGRLSYQKNPERLIDVLAKAIKTEKDISVAIIGTGELERQTKELVQKYGLHDNITFLGFQNNPLKILGDAKLMIMTSRFEGTPMCALEAMALGVPIVSTPVDGLIDLIQDGITGYLSDNDDLLAEKIIEIIQNQTERTRLSENTISSFARINNLVSYYENIRKEYLT